MLREVAAAAAAASLLGRCLNSLLKKDSFSSSSSQAAASSDATMYGGMGGGGNAWMKIMGISSAEVSKRNAAKEKQAGKAGSGGVAAQNALGDPG